jgi:hypothetical protein
MNAKERTKLHLVKAIKEVMVKKPLKEITVNDICSNANITRQTFYRHFKDKYDLIVWYFDREALKNIKKMGISCSLREGLVTKFKAMENDKVFFTSAFKVEGLNTLKDYDYHLIYNFYKDAIVKNNPDNFTSEIEFELKFYSYGAINMIVDWCKNDMPISAEKFADFMIDSFPPKLREELKVLDV